MKFFTWLIYIFFTFLCDEALAQACEGEKDCVFEEIDFKRDDLESHRTLYIMRIKEANFLPAQGIRIPALYPPAFTQKFQSISINSKANHNLNDVEIAEINNCILQRMACFLPIKDGGVRVGDSVVFRFYQKNNTINEFGRLHIFSFKDGIQGQVVVKGFGGGFISSGLKVRSHDGDMVFDSVGSGHLILSEIPSWKAYSAEVFASAWAGRSDPVRVAEIAKDIFPANVSPPQAVRIAMAWISQNIKYVYRPLTLKEMQRPADISSVISSREGDCKGMVLLLQSLLEAAGIKAVPAYTRLNGQDKAHFVDLDIPVVSYFDHVVLYVPTLNRYYDATLRSDQADIEITNYMDFSLNIESGQLSCLSARDCKGVPRYQLPRQ